MCIVSTRKLILYFLTIGLLIHGQIASHAQGIGLVLDSSSYTAVEGDSFSGSIAMTPVYDIYDSDYTGGGITYYGYITDWLIHSVADAPTTLTVSGSSISTITQRVDWPSNNYSPENFSVTIPNNGSPGYDSTATLLILNYDPDPGNAYAAYCDWYYCADGYFSRDNLTATVTVYNPNTTMQVEIIGNSDLTESESPQTATIRIYRGDTYNTRTVYYEIDGDAVNGNDYSASFTGSVTINAGSSYADIVVTTGNDVEFSKTLTLTLDDDDLYQVGANDSATITFEPDPDDEDATDATTTGTDNGGAQMVSPAGSTGNGYYVNGQKAGVNGTNGIAAGNSPFAFMNVLAKIPYASSRAPGMFTITRSGGTNAFTLNYTVAGTAVAGSNYVALPSSLQFGKNQTSTNIWVTLTNTPLASAQTVLFVVNPGTNYFLGYDTVDTVTLLPDNSLTNSVAMPSGRYYRGSGSDPTYWSQVIPLDSETGVVYSSTNGNCITLYPGVTNWSSQTLYHLNVANPLPQTNAANRIAFNNPVVAFGERTGGTPLYYSQPYNFGIYAGDPLLASTQIVIQAYNRSSHALAGTIKISPPRYTNGTAMATYAGNGFQMTTNAFGLTTTLSDSPSLSWGTTSLGAYVLTHTAGITASNYYYLVEAYGYPADGSNAMAVTISNALAPSLLYTLEFEPHPAWRSTFLDRPQFTGNPMPPIYAGKTVAEILTNTPPVTNAVNFTPSAATNLDDSPELRRHPALDNFVASMGNDPIALANYVLNNIDLTDPMDYSDSGNIAEQAINPGGVSRGALGTFMEKQGSAADQCALLIYLLRQAGVPALYEFAPRDGLQIMDARLSQMLKFQIQGATSEAGQLYTTNTMIPVNYPWVAAYIGTNWVHIFPWLKDYEITEGFNLYEYMPTNYSSAYPWVKDYIYGNSNLLAFATNGDDTPRVIFPAYLKQTLLQNHPGVSMDDIGVNILNRQHYYARWQDFPTPTWVTNASTALESLTSSGITNISPSLTNIFDTVSVQIYSVSNPTNSVQTGTMRLVDLHNREFYISQTTNSSNTNLTQLSLILLPFRTNIISQYSFTNDASLLSREVLTMNLRTNENQLGVRFLYQRHEALSSGYAIDPCLAFLGLSASEQISLERPLFRGDQAAICLDYGRVTQDMLNVHAQDIWQMETAVQANPSLTNSISPDVYEGATMYLAGMSYYKEISDFNQLNEGLHKVNMLSSWAAGLSKLGAARDSFGTLTNGLDPVVPGLDMFFYDVALVGNGTPDANTSFELAQQNFNLVSIINNSAEEHQTINRFYQQTNAVSTVSLLQLAQAGGSGIVALNANNYASQGSTNYQGQPLQNWDVNLWSTVSSALQNSPYTVAYMTPGPISSPSGSYSGMAALVLGWSQWAALISPQSLNGAEGQQLHTQSVTSGNSGNFNLSGGDLFSLSLTPPAPGTTLASPISLADGQTQVNGIINGLFGIDPTTIAEINSGSYLLGLNGSGTPTQIAGGNLQTIFQGGILYPDDGGGDLFDKILDPVHVVTGEFYIDDTDLQLPGPFPVDLRRNYSSQNLADNGFGTGWKLSMVPYLAVSTGGTNIYAADPDGSVLAYVRTNLTTNVWTPTLDANPQLQNNSVNGIGSVFNRLRNRLVQTISGSTTNYALYGSDGSVRQFQVLSFNNGALNQTRPYLQSWTDNRGNCLTFSFGTNSGQPNFGQLVRIQASNGNYLGFDYDMNAHIIDAYSGDGRRLSYDYDQYGDLVNVTLPDETTRAYTYQHATVTLTNGTATYSTHLIVEEDKPDGRALQNVYDSQRRVTNQLSTAGNSLTPIRTGTFVYANNFVLTNSFTNTFTGHTLIIDGNSHTNRYNYTNSLITQVIDPLGQSVQQIWFTTNTTAPGFYPRSVATRIDKRGLSSQIQYDSNGNITNTILTGDLTGNGVTTQTATNTALYNSNSLPVQMTDPAGNGEAIVYDPVFNFLPQQIIRYAGATPVSTNFMYYGDAMNVVVDGNVTQTNLAFGLMMRQVRAANSPDAATNDLEYNGNGFLTESIRYSGTTDPNVVLTYFYNERGQMVNQVDSLGASTYLAYDAMGRNIEQDNFDEFGNDLAWNFTYYDDNGEVNWTDGPRYNPEDYVYYDYDGEGRRTTEIHWRSEAQASGSGVEAPAGYNLYAQTFYQYDPNGNLLLTVDPRGAMTTNKYDSLNRVVQTTHLDTDGVTVLSADKYSYEPGGLVQSYTNALGGLTTNLYTDAGKPELRRNADGSTNAWRYYLDGRVCQEIQRNGAYWQTTYDDVNRITTRTFYSAAGLPEATNSVQLDRRGNVIQRVDEGGNTFTTAYDGLDRVKVAAGPAIVTVNTLENFSFQISYSTNVLQQASTNFYDAAGRTMTNINALGEARITLMDALHRPTTNLIYNAAGTLVREHYTAYSADHNSVTVTDGSGPNAIVHTTWADADGRTVLAIANPSMTVTEFTLSQYDLAGNLIAEQHDSATSGTVTTWTTNSFAYDGLNRLTSKIDRDGATTTYAYDQLGDLTNRTLPGSVQMLATYNNAGQKLKDWLIGGTSGTRTNTYAYFAGSTPFAGLLQKRVDGRFTTNICSYDDRLRLTNQIATGLLPEQNLTISWQFEPRGYVTAYSEQFANTNTGPTTAVQRSFDPYGELTAELVSDGAFAYSTSQTFDAAGRRTMLNIGGANYGFASQADGSLIYASNPTGSGAYGYDTAGMLTNRLVAGRNTGIISRDGEGRPLLITNTLNILPELGETLSWSPDGLLTAHTLNRPDFTDNRLYSYAPMSRRVTQEQLNLGAGATWTNSFAYDRGVTGGPGALTTAGPVGANFGLWWSGIPDAFSRVNVETNNAVGYLAYGAVNGQSTLSAWLDNRPIQIMDVGTNTMQWRTFLELTQGPHQLKVSALHPSGFYTAWATNSFTNNITYQVAADSYDGNGNITNRVWRNASGGTNRTQILSWDAKGRLREVIERNTNNYGFNWTAVYDGLNRRLATTTTLISNGVASTVPPQTLNSYYDPQMEFLELGVLLSSAPNVEYLEPGTSPSVQTIWKLYGPDLNGKYGGLNGAGGLEGVSPYLNTFYPVISDARGNVLAEVTNGVANWTMARPSGYGAVPGYRPVAFGNGVDLAQSCAWRGREVDVTGYYHLGLRDFDPDSGQWLSYDPTWNAADPNGQSFCGGDPINGFDSDGRCVEGFIAGRNENGSPANASPAYAASEYYGEQTHYVAQDILDDLVSVAQTAEVMLAGLNPNANTSPGVIKGFLDDTSLNGNADNTSRANTLSTWAPVVGNAVNTFGVGQTTAETPTVEVPPPDYNGPQTTFYVTPDGTVVPATGYRAVGAAGALEAQSGVIEPRDYPGTYISFDNLIPLNQSEIADGAQISPNWSTPTHIVAFDTLQTIPSLQIPKEYGGWGLFPEPIATSYPQYGQGGFTQATTFEPIQGAVVLPISGSTSSSPQPIIPPIQVPATIH